MQLYGDCNANYVDEESIIPYMINYRYTYNVKTVTL